MGIQVLSGQEGILPKEWKNLIFFYMLYSVSKRLVLFPTPLYRYGLLFIP